MQTQLLATSLGRLNVRQVGTGRTALLWHSLWSTRAVEGWKPLTAKLPAITAPTLFLTGAVDGQDWSPARARAAAATMRDARVVPLHGAGHISPLLLDTGLIASTVAEFWRST